MWRAFRNSRRAPRRFRSYCKIHARDCQLLLHRQKSLTMLVCRTLLQASRDQATPTSRFRPRRHPVFPLRVNKRINIVGSSRDNLVTGTDLNIRYGKFSSWPTRSRIFLRFQPVCQISPPIPFAAHRNNEPAYFHAANNAIRETE